jgi:soluble lytic murein transglycosylase-like protein
MKTSSRLVGMVLSVMSFIVLGTAVLLFAPKYQTQEPSVSPLSTTSLAAVAGGCTPINVSSPYVHLADQDAKQAGINPDCFTRHMYALSGLNPAARGDSGQMGIAYLTGEQARSLSVDPMNPRAALVAAAHLMKQYLQKFDNDYSKALVAYECGPDAVTRAERDGGNVWLNYIPADAHLHLNEVMR